MLVIPLYRRMQCQRTSMPIPSVCSSYSVRYQICTILIISQNKTEKRTKKRTQRTLPLYLNKEVSFLALSPIILLSLLFFSYTLSRLGFPGLGAFLSTFFSSLTLTFLLNYYYYLGDGRLRFRPQSTDPKYLLWLFALFFNNIHVDASVLQMLFLTILSFPCSPAGSFG